MRRAVERSVVESSPLQNFGTSFASSVAVFSRKSFSVTDHPPCSPDLAPAGLSLFQNLRSVLKGKGLSDIGNIKLCGEKKLTDIPVQDFKNSFEQWLKYWERCKHLQGDRFEKR
jgi:hypothetical protein